VNDPQIAIVDYGMGNLFSVAQACRWAGIEASITSSKAEISAAKAVILPGVGAFGVAMENLERLDLVSAVRDHAVSGKPMIGICLGLQLLMTESREFGSHPGLGVIDGEVVPLKEFSDGQRRYKVPHVGWNRINSMNSSEEPTEVHSNLGLWHNTLLEGLADGDQMYFTHSYHIQPNDPSLGLSFTRYGQSEFCSSLSVGNIFACQYHPERSGPSGLHIYKNLAALLAQETTG
jgi:glutamine amidotransferase